MSETTDTLPRRPSTRSLSPEEAEAELHGLIASLRTGILATGATDGAPEPSYTPFVFDEAGRFFIYVSRLARHTAHLLHGHAAGWMLIEDETSAADPFARRRATFHCTVHHIPRASEDFGPIMANFIHRFGTTAETLAAMTDFQLFALEPLHGRLVLGFGAAFRLKGIAVDRTLRGRHENAPRS